MDQAIAENVHLPHISALDALVLFARRSSSRSSSFVIMSLSAEWESDSESDSGYYSDSEYGLTAQQQWEESIEQIRGLVNLVLFPLLGKVLGRRTAHIIWHRFADWWFPAF